MRLLLRAKRSRHIIVMQYYTFNSILNNQLKVKFKKTNYTYY